RYPYYARQGSILRKRDDFVAHGRHYPLDHLQEYDLEKHLRFGHAKDRPGLILSFRYALYTAPVYFGEISGIIDNKGHDSCCHPGLHRGPEQQSRRIQYHEQLQHQRRPADYPHECPDQPFERFESRHRSERDHKPQRYGHRQGQDEQPDIEPESFEERRDIYIHTVPPSNGESSTGTAKVPMEIL